MSLVTLAHARRSTYPSSAKMHGGALGLAGGRRMRGGGFWSRLGDGFKSIFNHTKDFLTKSKAISTFAPLLGPEGAAIGGVAGLLGMGRYHNRVKGYSRKTGAVRRYTRRVPRKKCRC